jgi:excisionase family DNA binding protein
MAENNKNINTKAVLTFEEAVEYTGFTPGYLHKLTAGKKIPHSKPLGKSIFFDRTELESWLLKNRIEVEDQK